MGDQDQKVSKRPWVAEKFDRHLKWHDVYDATGQLVAQVYSDDIDPDIADANLSMVVNAVNAHDRMRAALAGLVKRMEQDAQPDCLAPHEIRADHACRECVPGGPIVREGFRCCYHAAKALLADPTLAPAPEKEADRG